MKKSNPIKTILMIGLVTAFLAACTTQAAEASEPAQTILETETPAAAPAVTENTAVSVETAELDVTETAAVTSWRDLPVVPEVSPAMVEVFKRGLADGRDPKRFSKIGDCQNITTYFLAMFDGGSYDLGTEYAYLKPTIDYFAGSWSRKSLAVKGGLNIISVQNIMWTQAVEAYVKKPGTCKKGETPLVCELRDNNPSFALISMEESWDGSLNLYDTNMRQIVEYVLSLNIIPILATRSELASQDRQINDMVVKIAQDYDLPLWNFGAAAAKLPDAGLREDGFHLTPYDDGSPHADFVDPQTMQYGWTWRNLTALQTLDAVRRGVGAE